MRVHRDAEQPHNGTTAICRDLGDRWILNSSDDLGHIIATHTDAVVVLSGTASEVVRATLRTASARELAKAHSGVS